MHPHPESAVESTVEQLPTIFKETKSGYKTTEFWIVLLTSVLVMVDGIPLPEQYEGFVAAGLAALYALSRGLAKQGVPHEVAAEPVVVPTAPTT